MTNLEVLLYKIINLLFRILGLIPRRIQIKIGNFFGRLFWILDKTHRQITIENLSNAYKKEKNKFQVIQLGRAVYKNLGQIIFEIAWSLKIKDKQDISKYITVNGYQNLEIARRKNKGMLVLMPHIGNWELIPLVLCGTNVTPYIVYRPLDFHPLDQFFINLRTRFGGVMVPARRAMLRVIRGLKKNGAVAVLLDQSVDCDEGVFVDFFGRRTSTNKGLALLALKTQAPVFPVFLVRNKKGFYAEIGKEIPLIKTGDRIKDIEENTQNYSNVMEDIIRRYPEQWFWVHRRWKIRPYWAWPRKQ